MTVESKATLKTHFEIGDRPTQVQFSNLIDSLAHVDELDIGFANAIRFGAVADWNGSTGTDNAAAILAAADAASAEGANLVIPPGEYMIASPIAIPANVSVFMDGATIISTSTDTTQAAVTIGDANATADVTLSGLSVRHSSVSAHDFPEDDLDRFAGIRLRNVGASRISLGAIQGFNIGLQLFPDDGKNCALNTVIGGTMSANKIGVELRGNTTSAYCNGNNFVGMSVNATSTMARYGNVVGIQFSAEPGGYTNHNDNVFSGVTFQVGDKSATYDWSASMAVSGGLRYFNAGNSYEVTNGDGTTGSTPPTHTTGTVTDDNGVDFTFRGVRRNTPVRFEGAGLRNKIIGARWETSYGPFMIATNPSISHSNVMEVYTSDDNAVTDRSIDDYSGLATATISANWNNEITGYGKKRVASTSIDDIHLRTINSADGTVVRGMGWVVHTSWVWSRVNVFGVTICADYIQAKGGSKYLAAIVPTRNLKRFLIHRETPVSSRLFLKAYGAALNPLTVSDAERSVVGGTGFSISLGGLVDTTTTETRSFLVPDDAIETEHVAVALYSSSSIRSIELQYVQDVVESEGVVSFQGPYGDSGRQSSGTPTGGIFFAAGEFIGNIDTAAAQPVGWYVSTAGALAPAWVTATAVIEGELRENGGNIYAAQSAGTTGATAPTGTGIDIDDGTVLWDFFSVEAALTATTQTY